MPSGMCLDDDSDCFHLAAWFVKNYDLSKPPSHAEKAYVAGKLATACGSYCTDNDEERLKIARVLARL